MRPTFAQIVEFLNGILELAAPPQGNVAVYTNGVQHTRQPDDGAYSSMVNESCEPLLTDFMAPYVSD